MTPQELKSSILQLAVQGKLVEQRTEEGTAEELYRQIQEEKQRLIKESKIKKEKPLPEITEDEIPFDIPESWKWVRLGSVSTYSHRKEKIISENITPEMWLLDLEDIEKETGRIIQKSSIKNRKVNGDKIVFNKGQILYSKLRPYLKKVLVAPENGVCTPEIVPFSVSNCDPQYFVFVLTSPYVDFVINSVTYGVKMPRVGTETMTGLLVPLPPLAEQKRIVAKIEELLPYVDRYEKAWSRLEDFNKRFPADMQKSVLQMAIQGKLVEQRPEEGTAEELYTQIQAEKRRLIKEGIIKKEKPLPEITEDKIPFDIPKSWKWVHLSDISLMIGDIDHKMPATVVEGIPYISPLNFTKNNGIDYESAKNVSFEDYEHLSKKCSPSLHDIIFPRYGTIGETRIIETDRPILVSYSCCTIKNMEAVFMSYKYVFYVLNSVLTKSEIKKYINKTTQPNVGLKSIKQFMFPLPPLAEQKRIVQKLKEILPLCEKLK